MNAIDLPSSDLPAGDLPTSESKANTPESANLSALAFQALVLDCNRNRRHFGALLDCQREAVGANPLCGDTLRVCIALSGEDVQSARYEGEMSAISIAAAESLCQIIEGMSISKACDLLERSLAAFSDATQAVPDEFAAFGIVRRYPNRKKTATLPIATLLAALRGNAELVSTE